MIKLKKIVLEILDDVEYEVASQLKDVIYDTLSQYTSGKYKKQPWEVIKFPKLKRIWEEFVRIGKVDSIRDKNEIDDMASLIESNIIKAYANTELTGHTSVDPQEYFDEFNMNDSEIDNFGYWIEDDKGFERISDYAFDKLVPILYDLKKQKDYDKRLILIDRILNVIHMRSDLASWFVSGGRHSLNKLSGLNDNENDTND